MAVLQNSGGAGMNPFADQCTELAPEGTYSAVIVDIADEFGVTRKKFEGEGTEVVDLTTFLFGFRDSTGAPYKVASKRMRISGNEKSALYQFLKSILGKKPEMGWDYCSLKGQQVLITIEHIERRDGNGVFASLAAVSPVPAGYNQPAPVTAPAPAATPAPTPTATSGGRKAVVKPAAQPTTKKSDPIPF